MKLSFPVDNGHYESPSSTLAYSECLGLCPTHPFTDGGVSRGGLTTMPGSRKFATIPNTGSYRGMFTLSGSIYTIFFTNVGSNNAEIFKIDSSGVVTTVGSMSSVGGDIPVIDNNGLVACIVWPDANKTFFYDDATGAVQETSADFQTFEAETGGVRSVTFIDGYFVFNTNESVFIGSLLATNSGKTFNSLNFVKPFLREKAIKVLSVRGDLVVMGENTTKFYSNIGGADFPFQEVPGATIFKGISGERNAIEYDNSMFFVGGGVEERNSIWRVVGSGAVEKISTDAVDRSIDSALGASGEDLEVSAFSLDGRAFLTVGDSSNCWCFDMQSSSVKGIPVWVKWSYSSSDFPMYFPFIRESYNKVFHVFNNDLHYLTYETSEIEDAASSRNHTFSSQYLQNQSDGMIINRLELVMETGIGNDPDLSITDTDPQVTLELSDDGGRTWTSRGSRSIGKNARYEQRLKWDRLSFSPVSRIFRFSCQTTLPLNFHRIDMDVEPSARNG